MAIYDLGDKQVSVPGEGKYWVADNATVLGSVVLKEGASVWFNVVIRGDNDPITIGENSNVQDGSVLHTDAGVPLTIGKNVTVGHMAMLHGCTIGLGTLVGIGSIILNGAKIGSNCLLGAGTLIPEDKEVPPNSVVMGAPGKVIRQIGDKEQGMLDSAAQHYANKYKRYRDKLRIDNERTEA